MFRTKLALAVAFSCLAAGALQASLIDPQGPDFLDIGVDGLALQATSPNCADLGHIYCITNMLISATGPVTDSFGANETDSFAAVLTADLVDTTTSTDLGTMSLPSVGNVTLDINGRSSDVNGTAFNDNFDVFDFSSSTVPFFSSLEIASLGPIHAGQTEFVGPDGGGQFHITSFFDAGIGLSINGGPLQPTQRDNIIEFDLVGAPEPGTFLLIVPGIALIAFRRFRASC